MKQDFKQESHSPISNQAIDVIVKTENSIVNHFTGSRILESNDLKLFMAKLISMMILSISNNVLSNINLMSEDEEIAQICECFDKNNNNDRFKRFFEIYSSEGFAKTFVSSIRSRTFWSDVYRIIMQSSTSFEERESLIAGIETFKILFINYLENIFDIIAPRYLESKEEIDKLEFEHRNMSIEDYVLSSLTAISLRHRDETNPILLTLRHCGMNEETIKKGLKSFIIECFNVNKDVASAKRIRIISAITELNFEIRGAIAVPHRPKQN